MKLCSYYQARIARKDCWFFVGVLRSHEYLCFDRTYDVSNSIFEFFVPETCESSFLRLMHQFEQQQIVTDLQRLDNRLADPAACV